MRNSLSRLFLALALVMIAAAGCTVNIAEGPRPRPRPTPPPPIPTPAPARATRVLISPTRTNLFPGATVRFVVRAYDAAGGEVAVQPSWSATGGRIAADGTFTAQLRAGTAIVRVTDALSGLRATAFVKVIGGAKPRIGKAVRISLSPYRTTVAPRGRVRFTARAYDRYNRPAPFKPIWKATGGTISSTGYFVAGGKPGRYAVSVRDSLTGVKVLASVRVRGTPTVLRPTFRLAISPTSVQLKPGASRQFSARAYDRKGKTVPARISWNATGGTITPAGRFTAGKRAGTYLVSASVGRLRSSAKVRVVIPVPSISRLSISPASAKVSPGKTVRFVVTAYDRSGRRVAVRPVWTASGGVISALGTFTAGRVPGNYKVTASVSWVRRSAVVHVLRSGVRHPKPKPPVIHKPIKPRPKPPVIRRPIEHKPKPPVVHKPIRPRPRPKPKPPVIRKPIKPRPRPPVTSTGSLKISRWVVSGRGKRKLECSVATGGKNVSIVRIYAISGRGKLTRLQSRVAKDGFTSTFSAQLPSGTKKVEIRLYNSANKLIATERRSAK